MSLAHRLPAAAGPFVGRAAERAWLRMVLARTPVAVVTGRGGAGKTSLGAHVLRELAAEPLYIRASADTPLAATVGAALNVDGELAAIVDAAEAGARWIFLDDVHRAGDGEARALLEAIAAHCSASRWLVASRSDPLARGVELLALGPLAASEVAELARAVAPELGDAAIDDLATHGDGLPATVHRAIGRRLLADRPIDTGDLAALPDEVRRFIVALDALAAPVPMDIAAELAAPPDDDTLDLLALRGLIELDDEGRIAVADAVRAMSDPVADLPAPDALLAAAERLAALEGRAARIDALRLAQLAGRDERARDYLDRFGHELADGGGNDLRDALRGLTGSAADAVRARAADADAWRALITGDLRDLDARLAGDARRGTGLAALYELRAITAAPLTTSVPSDEDPCTDPVAELVRLRRSGRFGIDLAGRDLRRIGGPAALAEWVAAEAAWASGDAEQARALIAAAVPEATEARWELPLRQLECELMVCAGARAEAAEAAATLARRAADADSPRFEAEARLLAMMSKDAPPSPTILEDLADDIDIAPVAARRARALLGGRAALDCVDERVLQAARRLRGWRALSQLPSDTALQSPADEWHSGWGIDAVRGEVWLPTGRVVDFSRWPVLWRLLSALADNEGRADKETLVCTVWAGTEYDPLLHDNRLQAAVRKLRHAIEEDPATPRRIVTTQAGYRLGGFVRHMRRSPR